MERVIIVDENDNFVRICERDQWNDGEIHQVSALWVSNSNGEILLAQRALAKKHAPGLWGPAAAGTVNEGETYESNVIKEAEEEIGLQVKPEQLEVGHRELVGKPDNRRFRQWFMVKMDVPLESLKLQEEEVMSVKWMHFSHLELDLVENQENYQGANQSSFPTLIEWTKNSLR